MVDRPLPPAYDAPDSPANKMREIYKSSPLTGDATKRMSILFEFLHRLMIHVVNSQPRAHCHLPGGQPSSQIAFGCRLAVRDP